MKQGGLVCKLADQSLRVFCLGFMLGSRQVKFLQWLVKFPLKALLWINFSASSYLLVMVQAQTTWGSVYPLQLSASFKKAPFAKALPFPFGTLLGTETSIYDMNPFLVSVIAGRPALAVSFGEQRLRQRPCTRQVQVRAGFFGGGKKEGEGDEPNQQKVRH